MAGHPDGQNYALWRGPNFVNVLNFPLSAANPLQVSGQVTNYASLIIDVFGNPVNGLSVLLEWFADTALTKSITNQGWDVCAGQSLEAIVPCIGNAVRITVSTTTVASTGTPISFFPTNTPAQNNQYFGTDNQVQGLSVSIPAGTFPTIRMPWVMQGQGHVYFRDVAASAHLTLNVITLNADGTRKSILQDAVQPVTGAAFDFTAPGEPIGLQIVNSDVVAHTCHYFCAIDGRV